MWEYMGGSIYIIVLCQGLQWGIITQKLLIKVLYNYIFNNKFFISQENPLKKRGTLLLLLFFETTF